VGWLSNRLPALLGLAFERRADLPGPRRGAEQHLYGATSEKANTEQRRATQAEMVFAHGGAPPWELMTPVPVPRARELSLEAR
jgi:hypothetical protein